MTGLSIERYKSAAGLQEKLAESLHDIYPQQSPRFNQSEQVNTEYFQSAFFLVKEDKVVSRAILYQNPKLSFEGSNTFLIGNFESVQYKEYAAQLLAEIESEANMLGAEYLIGPMNGSTWDTYRFAVSVKQAFFLEQIHPLYYNELFSSKGFKKIRSYYSTKVDISGTADVSSELSNKFIEEKSICIRTIDLENYDQELDRIHAFTLEAFATNFLFSPISKGNFKQKYRAVKPIIHPKFTLLALNRHNQLIACIFCVDDLHHQGEKTLIIKSIARHPDPRWKGIGRLLTSHIHQKALAEGYGAVIHAYMDGGGYSRPISATFSEEVLNEYALYGKRIL